MGLLGGTCASPPLLVDWGGLVPSHGSLPLCFAHAKAMSLGVCALKPPLWVALVPKVCFLH